MQEISTEVWKPIKGYEGIYEVSSYGRVKRLAHEIEYYQPRYGHMVTKKVGEQIIRQWEDSEGRYLMVCLHKETIKENVLAHRLVADTFIPNPNNLPVINHKDENKQNNIVSNLEWCTDKYNAHYGKNTRRKSVEQIGKDGTIIATYPSVRDAEKATGIKHESISAVCRGAKGLKTTGGYRWKYKEETSE